ncbi:MAG: hypothetical protein A2Z15_04495 [Chloroflexi bacterium RBG_16_50_11]|nr:MAG: hypothetical protein A2Z15_04495 [Chloroflexi bacterium RBG_16_50_11]
MKKLAIIILLLLLSTISLSCINADYENLANDYNKISSEYDELISKYNELVDSYNKLRSEYKQSIDDYNELRSEYNQLVDKYNKSSEQYKAKAEELQESFKQLLGGLEKELEGAIIPPYLLVDNRKVNLVFRSLNGAIEYWSLEVEALESSILKGQLMRTVEIPYLRYMGLQEIANLFYSGNKYIQIGKNKALDFRPYIVFEPFKPLALKLASFHTDEEGKIKEVWNMVTQLNKYSTEMKETPRLPLETLLLGGGDCEDLAILGASILRAMSSQWKISLVYMDSDNPSKVVNLNHVTVYVETGAYKTFVECTSNETMSPWEQVDGFYLEIK